MQKLREKSKLLRNNFKKSELKLKVHKNIQTNSNFFSPLRWNSYRKSGGFTSKTLITDRCLFTSSKKSFNKKFKLSRFEFLRNVRTGQISGFQKSVW